MQNQRFISVRLPGNSKIYDLTFDTKKKNLFGNFGLAIYKNKIYGFKGISAVKLYSNMEKEWNITRLKKLSIPTEKIKKENYIIILDSKKLISEKDMFEKYPPAFEGLYKKHNLKKVKITYNHKFLPIKLEGYFKSDNKKKSEWHILTLYSYKYNFEFQFNKEINSYIWKIKDGYFETK